MTRDEMAAYQRKRRASNPLARGYDRAYGRARNRALEQLAREYPTRFAELLTACRGEQGPDSPPMQAARRAVLEREGT